jgi:NAD(P)-dependent dehydrogenase (short-subunit alcohol dehydrogenase family)
MSKTIIIAGYGPGISHAVAEKFGAAGFSIALVARGADKLARGVQQLKTKGYTAQAFPADLGDLKTIHRVVQQARDALGPISVLHWNAAAAVAGDLLTAPVEELQTVFAVGVTGLVAAIQAALPDLRNDPKGAVLVTNGGFGLFVDAVDAMAVQGQSMGLSVGNAAKHKASRVLAKRLEPMGIFLGEVMVLNTVKGTAWDRGQATLEASSIGEKFWQLYEARKEHFAQVG